MHRLIFLSLRGDKLIEGEHFILLQVDSNLLKDKEALFAHIKKEYEAAKKKKMMLIVTAPYTGLLHSHRQVWKRPKNLAFSQKRDHTTGKETPLKFGHMLVYMVQS